MAIEHKYASTMDQLADVAASLFDRLLAIAQNIELDRGWDGQPKHVQDGICMLFAVVRNRTAGGRVESLTAELVGARAAFLTEQDRANRAESWRVAYKQMLRDVLDLMPAGYMSPEHQTKLMRAWSLVTDGEHQFKPRGSK